MTEGNLVQAGPPTATLLTTVVSLDPIYVYFEGDEQTYLNTPPRPGGSARAARATAEPGHHRARQRGRAFPTRGTSTSWTTSSTRPSGTIRARAVFSNKDRLFTPGLFARVKLVGSGSAGDAGPEAAPSAPTRTSKFVLVLKPDSTVDYRPVQLGRLVDGSAASSRRGSSRASRSW